MVFMTVSLHATHLILMWSKISNIRSVVRILLVYATVVISSLQQWSSETGEFDGKVSFTTHSVLERAVALSILFLHYINNGGQKTQNLLSQQISHGNFLLPQVLSNMP